jgi:hypothetical protein
MTNGGTDKFETWQFLGQLTRFMDQNRQMLGADPILFSLILEKQQRDDLIALITIDAVNGGFRHKLPFELI